MLEDGANALLDPAHTVETREDFAKLFSVPPVKQYRAGDDPAAGSAPDGAGASRFGSGADEAVQQARASLLLECLDDQRSARFDVLTSPVPLRILHDPDRETPEYTRACDEPISDDIFTAPAPPCASAQPEPSPAEGDGVSTVDDNASTVSVGGATTASLLDGAHAELQRDVQFDNFVDPEESLDPDDVSDLDNAEWHHVSGPRQPQEEAPPAEAAALCGVQALNRDRGTLRSALDTEPAENKPFIGPAKPAPKLGYSHAPVAAAVSGADRRIRTWLGRVQSAALPPGWKVDASSIKSVPPDVEADRPRVEDAVLADDVQRLHHALVSGEEGLLRSEAERTNGHIATDADLYLSHKERQAAQAERPANPNPGPSPGQLQLAAANDELFSSLNVPGAAASSLHEAVYSCPVARAVVDEHTADLATARGGEAAEASPDPPAPPAAGTAPPDATTWHEETEPFALDPDFDYDNIVNPTPKPRTPWEV
ncbi:hypothetical protein DIPPA_25329 [Diplonema papillatum]|nr:hypothetical protein DIPPA_25329 [Diplonema papillatum]